MDTATIVTETTHPLQPLISDLGLILMTAGIAVLLFKKQKNLKSRIRCRIREGCYSMDCWK